jgi:hypothetical protein
VDLAAFATLATSYDGVREVVRDGRRRWQYDGRLVARELSATTVVVRIDLDLRAELVRRHPATFSVPTRWARHMMVVADLAAGDDGAVEDAVAAAYRGAQTRWT